MLIRKETLDAVYALKGRYLNSQLFLYFEELDFCSTSRKLGYETVATKQAIVYHKMANSSGGLYNPLTYYYHTRNCILQVKEFLPLTLRVLFYPFNLLRGLARVVKNVIHRRFYSALAILYGLWDGHGDKTGKWKYHDLAKVKWQKLK